MGIPLVDLRAQYAGIRSEIEAAVRDVLESARFVGGPQVEAFEREFASFLGVPHALGVSSGTSALHLALIATGVGPGDEVLLPAHTFIATAEVVRRTGARARFCEIDETTMTCDPGLLERALTPKVKVLIPVHLYGHPAEMDPILDFARTNGLEVIEDAAQAHGAAIHGKRCGSFAPLGTFSFYPGKNLGSYGEGGLVSVEDGEVCERLRRLADHGRLDKYLHGEEGFNYRLHALQAAILRVKLRHLSEWNLARRRVARLYDERLEGVPGVSIPRCAPWAEHVYHLYVVRLPGRDRVLARLKDAGVDAGIHYPVPLHLQPAFSYLGYNKGDFPVTEAVCREILSLPIYPELTEGQVDQVVEALKKALSS